MTRSEVKGANLLLDIRTAAHTANYDRTGCFIGAGNHLPQTVVILQLEAYAKHWMQKELIKEIKSKKVVPPQTRCKFLHIIHLESNHYALSISGTRAYSKL